MGRRLDTERGDGRPVNIPPGWPQYLMTLAGVALLIGPTLAVLWPK